MEGIIEQASNNTLFHYTTLEKLALILSTKSMMLRALTSMDDLLEDLGDIYTYGRYVFVSSWMRENSESIAMWNLYSNMKSGVRIEMERNPFKTYIITAEDLRNAFPIDIQISEEYIEAVVPLEQWIGKDCSLINFHKDQILEEVKYVDNPRELTKGAVISKNGSVSIEVAAFGKYKSKYWEFQNEERYILRFAPINYIKLSQGVYGKDYFDKVLRGPSKAPNNIFLKFNEKSFKKMRITTAPEFSDGNAVLLESLVEKYNPGIKIQYSDLKNKIRM